MIIETEADGTTIKGTLSITPASEEIAQADGDANKHIVPDDSIIEDIDLYEYVGGAVSLVSGWAAVKATRQAAAVLSAASDNLTKKSATITADFNNAVTAMKAGYSDDEVKSWDKQEQEAAAYLASSSAPTPLLSSMVARRGDTVAELAAKVAANAVLFTAAYGDALGLLHSKEAALALIDLTAVDAIAQIEAV
jgi:hypothetical protein